jgi:hypothetical protein
MGSMSGCAVSARPGLTIAGFRSLSLGLPNHGERSMNVSLQRRGPVQTGLRRAEALRKDK